MEKLSFICIAFAIVITGCGVPSVHPLYENDDLILHEKLSGVWTSDNDTYYVFNVDDALNNPSNIPVKILGFDEDTTETVSILEDIKKDATELAKKGLEKIYYIAKAESDEVSELYYGGLIKLDEDYYLDLFRIRIFEEDPFRFPTHVFVKAEFKDGQLILHEFKTTFLEELINNQQIRIKHEYADEKLLLTASSKELQKFILKYGNTDNAYDDIHTFTKQ